MATTNSILRGMEAPQAAGTLFGVPASISGTALPDFIPNGSQVATQDTLTALAGGGQANATATKIGINRFTTVATPGDSGVLPASAPGATVRIINSAANQMQIFGNGTDTINGIAGNVGVPVDAGEIVEFICVAAGAWYRITPNGTQSLAAAGNSQGTASLIEARVVNVTGSTGTNGVLLPAPIAGDVFFIGNAAAAVMKVYPPTGGQINGGGANAAFSSVSGKPAIVWCVATASGGTWYAISA